MLRSRKFWGAIGILVVLWGLNNPVSAANALSGLVDGADGAGDSATTFVENVELETD